MANAPGPPPRTLKIIAAITLVLSAIPMAGGVYALRLGVRAPRSIDVPALMDRDRTPVGDFVTVRITPSLERLYLVNSVDRSSDDYLLGVADDEYLVVYAETDSDLGEAIRAHPGADTLPPREVSGIVHDFGDYEHLTSDLPGYMVDRYVLSYRPVRPQERVRVLEVGPGRARFTFIGAGSILSCGLPLIALALYALARARKLGPGPARF